MGRWSRPPNLNMRGLSMRNTAVVILIIAITAICLIGVVGGMDIKSAEEEHARYCHMVQIYYDTNGRDGWPPYDGDDVCRQGK